jgi:hypothetical protein
MSPQQVHALSSQLSEREAELTQEKLEVRKLAALFKQVGAKDLGRSMN